MSQPYGRASSTIAETIRDLGERMERYRVSRDLRQQDVAAMAGISRRTLVRLEQGEGASLETVLRILKAYGIEDRLLGLVPDAKLNPLDRRAGTGYQRKRASGKTAKITPTEPWGWGSSVKRGAQTVEGKQERVGKSARGQRSGGVYKMPGAITHDTPRGPKSKKKSP